MEKSMTRSNGTTLLVLTALELLALSCWGQQTNQGLTAELTVALEKQSFRENDEVTGSIRFQLLAPKDWPIAQKPTVNLNGPQLNLVFDPEFAALPTAMEFGQAITNPVRIGQRYEIPFKVSLNAEVKRLLSAGKSTRSFNLGQHSVQAEVHSPAWASWHPPPNNLYPELVASFASTRQQFSIEAAGCEELKHQDLLQAMRDADEGWKLYLASFFLIRGKLRPEEILPGMSDFRPETKGRLAHLYSKYGGSPKQLTFFQRVRGQVLLDDHTNAPFFLRLDPKENVRFVCQGSAMHNVNGIDHNYVLGADIREREKEVRAPAQPGVYRVVCDIHSSPWGWILIDSDQPQPELKPRRDSD